MFSKLWVKVLIIGGILFLGTELALRITANINYVPTLIMLGAFLVPTSYVAYFIDRERQFDSASHSTPWGIILFCFLAGGVIGTIVAGLLEFATLKSATLVTLLGIGVFEESAKLIFPVIIFFMVKQFHTENDGLLFGVAVGMGFAALETMGYSLAAMISSKGNIGTLEQILIFRGLLSPVGHAAWTGIICAVIWRERLKHRQFLSYRIVLVFALVVILHTSWNLVSSFNVAVVNLIGYLVIGGISLLLLIQRVRAARLAA